MLETKHITNIRQILICNKKSNGPRTEPWRTPQLISNGSYDLPLIVTLFK